MKKITFLIAYLLVFYSFVFAQDTQFLVNWKSGGFVPAFYQGKNLPTNQTAITASFSVVNNGRQVNLSARNIQWFVNGKQVAAGRGLQKLNFFPDNRNNNDIVVRIVAGDLEKLFVIPAARPEVVIDNPAVDKTIASGVNTLRSWPFFFNVDSADNIIFRWIANNQESQKSVSQPNLLELELPEGSSGSVVNLIATAQNLSNPLETGRQIINLLVR